MKQSKKGQQWYFGMKAHIGVDAESGLVHTVRGTAGNVADVVEANSAAARARKLKRLGDAGYQGVDKRPDAKSRGAVACGDATGQEEEARQDAVAGSDEA
jgi:IS5 family transposase